MSSNPSWFTEPCIMGIDEAGRGPVLGPMVYACCIAAAASTSQLATRDFADSKTLTEAKRESLFEEINTDPTLAHDVESLSAATISAEMLSPAQVSLNVMAANATMALIQRALDRGVHLTEVFIDTVGDADRYKDKLSNRFPHLRFTVCPKADALYPIVSAASIVAKVTRDRALLHYVAEEPGLEIDRNFGSGYPGDAPTKAWLQKSIDPVFGFPSLVRFSWSTAVTLLKDSAVPVTWATDDNAGQATLSFGRGAPRASAATSTCAYFRSRKLQNASVPLFNRV